LTKKSLWWKIVEVGLKKMMTVVNGAVAVVVEDGRQVSLKMKWMWMRMERAWAQETKRHCLEI
jgi:hypothetical protein